VATELLPQTTAATAESIPVVEGGLQVWLADPPWYEKPYSVETGSNRAVDRHYGTMPLEEIHAMGKIIKARSAPHAMLFLWLTWPHLQNAMEVAKSWGFRYSSNAWVWVKGQADNLSVGEVDKLGAPILNLRHGRGHTTRKATELCLLFRRGQGIPRADRGVSDVLLAWPEGRNSRKPEEQYARIETFLGPGHRCIELFARKPHRAPGWTVWGNEA
jgi:N6-adenosine-specific RNA methylase IME4